MELPKFNETFLPILEILKDKKVVKGRELIRLVEEKYYFGLSKELLEQRTKSGGRLIENRIAWGKSYLKKGGLVHYPQRGFVQITQKGIEAINKDLTLEKVQSNVINFYEPENESLNKNESVPKSASPEDLIELGIDRIEKEVKNELLSKLKEVDPFYFEKIILKLLNKMGYGKYIETPKTGDGGIDGIINEDQLGLEKIYIQAKRYNDNKVRETEIRNFIGAMSGDTRKGIFVTTSSFDNKAINKAKDAHHTIILIDGNELVQLMHDFDVGVQTKNSYNVKIIDNDFFETDEF